MLKNWRTDMAKVTINARTKDNSAMVIEGNRHKIKLESGEVIDVVTDRREVHPVFGRQWFVTHIDSGLNIVPPRYYCYPHIIWDYDIDLDPTTERNALKIAKHTFNTIYRTQNKTFAQILEEREKQLKGYVKWE